MGSHFNCEICNKIISIKNYAVSRHVKSHNLSLEDYISKYYTRIGNFEKCGFCEREAVPKYLIDHIKKEYSIKYESGYSCNTIECKKLISMEILGHDYDPKSYEKIGSRSKYLSKLYKIDINSAKKMKYNENNKEYFDNSLDSFKKIYGEVEGVIKYKDRIEKISKRGDMRLLFSARSIELLSMIENTSFIIKLN
jgi:hypothetical protein